MPPAEAATPQRTQELFRAQLSEVYSRGDRLFVRLFFAQWLFAIGLALKLSPFAWDGTTRSVHIHVYYAVLFGGALTIPTWFMVRAWPGATLTRHMIAVLQMMWSGLLIHLSGGRVETHFHIFGSLAFLAFYRDWKVLVPAGLVTVLDHFLRGMFWPESIFGLANVEWWRFLEHGFWVLFEDVVLVIGILQSRSEMLLLADRQAELESGRKSLLSNVAALTEAQASLVRVSRQAGMAEVATSVLHNIGNVLNSVNVSAGLVVDVVRRSNGTALSRAVTLLKSQPAPGRFLDEDPRGPKLLQYLGGIATALDGERQQMSDELGSLTRNIDHIKAIVALQQSHAKGSAALETMPLHGLLDDALKFNAASYQNNQVEVVRDFGDTTDIVSDRHSLLQILMNLLSNARHALDGCEGERKLTLRARTSADTLTIEVIDTGTGIHPERMNEIFRHGFTTKKDGHGFGLHSSANVAAELGGSLTAASAGPGQGATFTLSVPASPPRHAAPGASSKLGREAGGGAKQRSSWELNSA